MEGLLELTPVALIAFGGVWFLNLLSARFLKRELSATEKFVLSVAVAFAVGFVPAELGSDIANRLRDAVGIATGLAGAYQALSRIASRV